MVWIKFSIKCYLTFSSKMHHSHCMLVYSPLDTQMHMIYLMYQEEIIFFSNIKNKGTTKTLMVIEEMNKAQSRKYKNQQRIISIKGCWRKDSGLIHKLEGQSQIKQIIKTENMYRLQSWCKGQSELQGNNFVSINIS